MDTLLSMAATDATSADVTVAAGATVTLVLTGPGRARVQAKGVGGQYKDIGWLHGRTPESALNVNGPVTFRVHRAAQNDACAVGVEKS